MTDETVADVLRAVDSPRTWKLVEYADPVPGPQPDMDYEDWVRPLKLTGGRVCLRWRDKPADRHGYVYWQPDGLRYTFGTGRVETGPDAVHCFRYDLQSPTVNVTPVLREDTPFGETGDE